MPLEGGDESEGEANVLTPTLTLPIKGEGMYERIEL